MFFLGGGISIHSCTFGVAALGFSDLPGVSRVFLVYLVLVGFQASIFFSSSSLVYIDWVGK